MKFQEDTPHADPPYVGGGNRQEDAENQLAEGGKKGRNGSSSNTDDGMIMANSDAAGG
eukprot:CAMPEP_0119565612 /NCGR_PEP_ID=MMETSP1352-20130426/30618_1 /TAXON_ID=265584 /ORGANISM="Stauroneis constricta, Strain CCMP1120" /LENGTH=57 /DNA_ID=CAMNT_0007614567 /DNA_START=80 /DNA_END=250 /DNA_ORIENTATION=-